MGESQIIMDAAKRLTSLVNDMLEAISSQMMTVRIAAVRNTVRRRNKKS